METIVITRDRHVATVTLNRPEKLNAQDEPLLLALDAALRELDRDASIHVVVLAGAGSSFSAGHDLSYAAWDPSQLDTEKRHAMEKRTFVDTAMFLRDLSKPTIARVQGYCLGAGLMLAAMCDLIVAAQGARFGNPVIGMAAAGLELLVEPWDMGVRKAKELLFTGRQFDAEDARRMGLVNTVTADDELVDAVDALAQEIAAQPPFAISMLKRSLNATLDAMGQRTAFEQHFMTHLLVHGSTESTEFFEEVRRQGGGFSSEGFHVLRGLMNKRH
jgi:enoyl-CoA hydratase